MAAAVLLAVVSWAVMDELQSNALNDIYETEYTARLYEQAAQDRKRFDVAIHAVYHATTTIINLHHVINYVDETCTREGNWNDPKAQIPNAQSQTRTPWMPTRSFLREHFVPDNILLLDPLNRVHEILSPTGTPLPKLFTKPLVLLAAKSQEQALITNIDGVPYIVASGQIKNDGGKHIATLLSLSRIDTRFLRNTQEGYLDPDSVIALVSGAEENIIASTNNSMLPIGDSFPQYADQFLITGKEFFDYGSSEIHISFLTLIPRSRFEELLTPVLEVNRQHRTILAALFTALLIVFLLYLTRRIRNLREAVAYFTQKVYGATPPQDMEKGDELESAQAHFTHLTEEILKSREELEEETRQRIIAVQRHAEFATEVQRLSLMSSVTDALGVGVLEKRDGTFVPRTKTMESFIKQCGGVEQFISATPGQDLVVSCGCKDECTFAIDIPENLDAELILVRDVTTRRNAERQIESLALFPAQNPSPVIRASAEGKILMSNQASDALFKHWGIDGDILPDEIRSTVSQALSGDVPIAQEIDLDERTFVMTYSPVPNDQHVNIYVTDITARKQAETELQHAHDKLEDRVEERTKALSAEIEVRRKNEADLRKLNRAVEQTAHMVFITDVDGIIEYVNPKFTEWMGYTPSEAIGQKPSLIKSSETPDEVYEQLWQTILSGQEWRGEMKDLRKNGEAFWASTAIAPVRDDDGNITHFIASHEDITQRKEAEIAIQTALEQADIANRAKTDLMANMSHELRTPLNAIIGFSSTMKEEIFGPVGNDKYREYLDDIHNSGQHLLGLINDILDVSAIEAGAVKLYEENISISEVVDASIRIIMPRANDGKVAVSSSISSETPQIFADERRVKQIFLNLLSNAVKFTPEGGEVAVHSWLNEDASLSISVGDTGTGMDEDEVKKALSKFGQVDSGLDRKHEGTGLGLPLTIGLMGCHGGTLDVKSEKGQGTQIIVTVPKERVTSPL